MTAYRRKITGTYWENFNRTNWIKLNTIDITFGMNSDIFVQTSSYVFLRICYFASSEYLWAELAVFISVFTFLILYKKRNRMCQFFHLSGWIQVSGLRKTYFSSLFVYLSLFVATNTCCRSVRPLACTPVSHSFGAKQFLVRSISLERRDLKLKREETVRLN